MSDTKINAMAVALRSVEDALNVMGGGSGKKETVQQFFGQMHRTLQQQFVSIVIIPILQYLDACYENGRYDARNQASVDLAHKMITAAKDDLYLPLI